MKAFHATEIGKANARARALKGAAAARAAHPTSIERLAMTVLDALGIEYISNQRIDRYVVDILIPSQMLVIECDGSYWHSLPGAPEKDARRDARLRELGYRVERIGEHDFQSGRHQKLLTDAVGLAKESA